MASTDRVFFVLILCALASATIWPVPCPGAVCPYQQIVTVAGQAQDGDTIQLANGEFVGGCGGAIFAQNNLLFVGNGTTTISCGNTGPAITFTGNNPTVTNILFNHTLNGAVVFQGEGGTLNRVFFQDITNGGVIGGDVIANDCFFFMGTSTGSGGAIFANSSLVVNGGLFQNLQAQGSGGAIYVNGDATIVGASIGTCRAGQYGGGISAEGNLVINDTSLSLNDAGVSGSAVYGYGPLLTIINCDVRGNGLSSGAGAIAGGIVNILGGTFVSNSASGNGGAVTAMYITITGAAFSQNTAVSLGGAVYGFYATVSINSNYTQNVASGGGAINGWRMTISGGTFTKNYAETSYLGGGAILANYPLVVTGPPAIFIQNSATCQGGAISISFPSSPVYGIFIGNTGGTGGAIGATNGLQLAAPEGVSGGLYFSGNFASQKGGAAYSYSTNFNITGGIFTGNSAGYSGGGVFSQCDQATDLCSSAIVDSIFENNCAGDGGAILVTGDNMNIVNVTFAGNMATTNGGAISLSRGSVTLAANTPSFFSNNFATEGAAFFCSAGSLLLPGSDPAAGLMNGLPIPTNASAPQTVTCSACGCCQPLSGVLTTGCFLWPGQPCDVTCDVGFAPTGNTSALECVTPPNQYSGRAACQAITCAALNTTEIPEHASIAPGTCAASGAYGSACQFACQTGFALQGAATTGTCTAAGVYEGQNATCAVITCAALSATNIPAHASVVAGTCVAGGVYGSTCQLACDAGYTLQGVVTVGLCTAQGVYTGQGAPCVATTLPAHHTAAIIAGVIAGVVLLGIGAFCYWRRGRGGQGDEAKVLINSKPNTAERRY